MAIPCECAFVATQLWKHCIVVDILSGSSNTAFATNVVDDYMSLTLASTVLRRPPPRHCYPLFLTFIVAARNDIINN
jgi:hypothetical protein